LPEVIAPFRNHLPVRIRFGEGCVAELADILASEGRSRPYLLLDGAVAELRALGPALARVEERVGAAICRKASAGEPTFESAETIGAELRDAAPDAIVAIGGGSVMDTAKAARLVFTQGEPLRRFLEGGAVVQPPAVPLVTVPTTAGTGSEVTGGAVLHDAETGRKRGIADPLLRAQHALVDPELTVDLPREPTAYSGIDALAQALAPTVTTSRTPIGNAIGLEATRLATGALPVVARDPANRAARSQMACASLLAGLAMNISECGAEHWLAHPFGARFGLAHGLTVGLMLAEAMEIDRHAAPERFERIADAMGAPGSDLPDGSRAVSAVRTLLAEIDFPTLSSSGVRDQDLSLLADDAIAGWIPVTPHEWTREDVLAAYGAALSLEQR
jgi:alcohol dehydrogenase